jgi:hypothetical protein
MLSTLRAGVMHTSKVRKSESEASREAPVPTIREEESHNVFRRIHNFSTAIDVPEAMMKAPHLEYRRNSLFLCRRPQYQ